MDVNLTYGVPLQLNVTLNTPASSESFWASTLGIALIGALFALIGAAIASYGQIYLESLKNVELKRNNQILARNNLRGSLSKLPSYYSIYLTYRINEGNLLLCSRLDTINSLNLRELMKTKTAKEIHQTVISEQSKQPNYIEGIRVRGKAEEFLLTVPKASEDFGSFVGQIEILFRDLDIERKIENLVKDIETAEDEFAALEGIINKAFLDPYNKLGKDLLSLTPDKLDEFINGLDVVDQNRDDTKDASFSKIISKRNSLESKIRNLLNHLSDLMRENIEYPGYVDKIYEKAVR